MINHLPCRRPRFNPWVRIDPLEKEVATHSSILAGKIPLRGLFFFLFTTFQMESCTYKANSIMP